MSKGTPIRGENIIGHIYDVRARAMETSQPYRTRLDPLPGPNWLPHIHPPRELAEYDEGSVR